LGERTEATDAPAILLDAVVKSYGQVRALDGLSLRVGRGELYGFLGPNGAGKTTAIRVALGLARLDAGRAELFGVPVPPRSVIHRVGFVPQEPALYRDLTVRENLELFADVFGLHPSRWSERFGRVLTFVDLDSKADVVVRNLSGGQVRRTSIAVAMVHDPDLLVLDEPTVGVDPELRASFWDHFEALKEQGKSILITTHYVAEANRCDRVGFVRAGTIVAEGPPADLLALTGTTSLDDAFLAFLRREKGASA
jgi:ABC-2 type transport system ATP-binding protein